MRFSGVGLPQLVQLADAMVAAEHRVACSQFVRPARCFGLVGTLGAGKTRFCQEIARALGVDPAEVTSPTFTLLKSYELGRGSDAVQAHTDALAARPEALHRLHHLDLYRVADEDELWELGLEELCETPGTWTLIEWADRFADALPHDLIWIRINLSSAEVKHAPALREIEIIGGTPEQAAWLAEVRLQWDAT